MAQIIPRAKTFSSELGLNLGQGVSKGIGERLSSNEKMRQTEFESKLKGEQERKKLFEEKVADEQSYSHIKDIFGEKFADIWKVAPIGGRTALLQHGLEAKLRGENLEDMLKDFKLSEKEEIDNIEGIETKEAKQEDFDKGTTPKERIARQEKRYAQNLPLYQEAQKKKIAQEMIGDEIEILQDLSPQIGVMERFNINPKSGDILIPALASPEAQRFLKTVNDFTIQAKDSYGSRVTNFDLANFMRRLPTLANSEEGRRQILQQMKIINDINIARENSLHEVIDEYGGIRNIDYDKAETLAEKKASKKISELKKQFKEIGSVQDKAFDFEIKEAKRLAPKGEVTVLLPDGRIGSVPASEVNKAIKKGAKVL